MLAALGHSPEEIEKLYILVLTPGMYVIFILQCLIVKPKQKYLKSDGM